jgi:hypothetical protein
MKKSFLIACAAGAVMLAASSAGAMQGCGGGFHRGPNGYCRPNGPAVVVRPGAVVVGPTVGGYYHGRGYWDGHRYYAQRYYHGGGWRYR